MTSVGNGVLALSGQYPVEDRHRVDRRAGRQLATTHGQITPLSSLLLFSDQEGIVGPATAARRESALREAQPLVSAHVEMLANSRGDASAVAALAERLAPTPDIAALQQLAAECPGDATERDAMARAYFTLRRDHAPGALLDPAWPAYWARMVGEMRSLFATVGAAGCVRFDRAASIVHAHVRCKTSSSRPRCHG